MKPVFDQSIEGGHRSYFGDSAGHDVRHSNGECHRASGPATKRLTADLRLDRVEVIDVGMHFGERLCVLLGFGHVDIDRPIICNWECRRCDQSAHCHHAFHKHRSIADHAQVFFGARHLWSGAGGDQGVEPRYRPAHDANKDEWEDTTIKIWATAVGEERVDRGCFHARIGDDHSQHQQ